ncbi:hypothetical protein F2Q68_00012079, partial [Brassica cretica]
MAISRDEDIPALVYEARPVIRSDSRLVQRRVWREQRSNVNDDDVENNVVRVEEEEQRLSVPLIDSSSRPERLFLKGLGWRSSWGLVISSSTVFWLPSGSSCVDHVRCCVLLFGEAVLGSFCCAVFFKPCDVLKVLKVKRIYTSNFPDEFQLSFSIPLAVISTDSEKKICDHPLLSTKRAAEDVLEGMESTLTPEEAGVAERLAMHIADNVDTDDFQTKNDSISCKLSFIMSLLTRKMLSLIQDSLTSNCYSFLRIDGTTKAPDRLKTVEQLWKKIFTESRCTREACLKTVTEHKEQIRYFSQQDLRELFSLPKGGFDVSPTQQQLYGEHYNQIKLDEFLESHVKFLETLGISGVSHQSLLFSKTALIQQNEVEEIRKKERRRRGTTSYLGGPSASSSQDNMNN